MIQHEYGMSEDAYKSHTPREISDMVYRIIDRKTGYKRTELTTVSTFTESQEEKIKKAKQKRFQQNEANK